MVIVITAIACAFDDFYLEPTVSAFQSVPNPFLNRAIWSLFASINLGVNCALTLCTFYHPLIAHLKNMRQLLERKNCLGTNNEQPTQIYKISIWCYDGLQHYHQKQLTLIVPVFLVVPIKHPSQLSDSKQTSVHDHWTHLLLCLEIWIWTKLLANHDSDLENPTMEWCSV